MKKVIKPRLGTSGGLPGESGISVETSRQRKTESGKVGWGIAFLMEYFLDFDPYAEYFTISFIPEMLSEVYTIAISILQMGTLKPRYINNLPKATQLGNVEAGIEPRSVDSKARQEVIATYRRLGIF